MVQARDEGLTRFIGVTGHGLRIAAMHVRSLERFDFDSVLFPYNHALLRSEVYRSDVEALRRICGERSVAMQTIKSMARGRWTDQSLVDSAGTNRSPTRQRSIVRFGMCSATMICSSTPPATLDCSV